MTSPDEVAAVRMTDAHVKLLQDLVAIAEKRGVSNGADRRRWQFRLETKAFSHTSI